MITDPHLMPDFRDSLEQALYRRASVAAPAPALRLPRVSLPRPTIAGRLALGAAVLVAAIAVVFTTLPGKQADHTAFGEPLVFAQRAEAVPAGFAAGAYVKSVLGKDATYVGAIRVSAAGQSVYLLKARTGWCVAPVPASRLSGAPLHDVICARTEALKRTGISISLPREFAYFAAIPPQAAPPTLITADGTRRQLPVSSAGVVGVAGLHPGDRIVRHGVDGTTLTDVVQGPGSGPVVP